MDARFQPAVVAISAGDVDRLGGLLGADPSLATSRSSTSHPTLLQCLALGPGTPNQLEMARLFVDVGADLDGPLIACASCDNVEVAVLLLDHGAAVNGRSAASEWSPLEEALYWNRQGMIALLLARGATVHNLRIAAGLGRPDVTAAFFTTDGELRPEAGSVNWPWGGLEAIEASNFDRRGKDRLAAKFSSFRQDRQAVIDNAFVYACMHGHVDAATLLLEHGAELDVMAGGFDYSGTALHYAALNGRRETVELLLDRGANPHVVDDEVGTTPAAWADHGGHPDIGELLRQRP